MLPTSMNKALLLVVLSLPCFAGCRGMKYNADVGPFFAVASGDVGVAAPGATPPSFALSDLDSDLGLGDTEVSPYVRLQTDIDRHRVRLHGFGVNAEGSGTLDTDYGGIVAGAQVETDMDFLAIGANYGFQLWSGPNYRIGVGAAANYYGLDVAARSSVGRETVQTDVIVPMPFVEIEGMWRDFTLGANGAVMSADLGDASGRYLDIEAYLRWQMLTSFDLMAGYRYLVIDAYGSASGRDFDADVTIQGYFFTAGVRF
jgi:hypothetical protein